VGALGAAAALTVAVRGGWTRVATPTAPPPVVATVDRLEGHVQRVPAGRSGIGPGATLAAGDAFATGDGRLGLRLSPGTSVRFDRGTHARLISSRRIALSSGAVYLDNHGDLSGVEIETAHGLIRDIGTQFEVRTGAGAVRVRVRTGSVEVRKRGQVLSAHAGTQLTVRDAGHSTSAIAPYGAEWSWAAALAPVFETNGRTLAAFVDHLCREQGWTPRYATDALARQADTIVLHGSLGTLSPTDALAAALLASGLTYRIDRGHLIIVP
jgi:ferric-dicitrate binding protein FerR (iron transport regulator)